MARWTYLPTAFVVLAAWGGAQTPAPPISPEDKLRLHRANSPLIEQLVHDGVALSNAADPVQRAERCREASVSLALAIQQAVRTEDAGRVTELTGLYRDLLRDGLVPTLNDARREVTPDSPGGKKLRELRTATADNVAELKAQLPAGKLAAEPGVKDALKQLDELAEALNK
jgi:hypothetical protein